MPASGIHVGARLLVMVTVLAIGCSRPEPDATSPIEKKAVAAQTATEWPEDERRHDVFVGSHRCAACHQKIFDSYTTQHPMARSINLLDSDKAHAAFPTEAKFSRGACDFEVALGPNGKIQHSEATSDSDGVIYRQTESLDFAIGSGQRGYSFVLTKAGCFYQSPVTWYSQAREWDLSPGYRVDQNPRFGRRMTGDCIFCHAGNPNRDPDQRDRFLDPPFHEASISCERCHGAGDSHVSFHESADGTDDIINPSSLSPTRRDSVCYQCHLHGKDRIVRAGRSSYDFRPGDLVSDIWAVLVEDAAASSETSEFEAVSQPEQMVSSVCYIKSKGRLGCISCHSPHSIPNAQDRVRFYRNRCIQCHGDDQTECSVAVTDRLAAVPEDSCIHCHMPSAAASDVPHTAQTDHRILRRYVAGEDHAPGNRLTLFERNDFPLSNAEFQRALGLRLESTAATRSDAQSALQLLSPAIASGADVAAVTAASWLLLRLGDFENAGRLADQAISQENGHESALEARAIAFQQSQEFSAALQAVDRILAVAPWSAVIHSQRAEILLELERPEEAIMALEKSLNIDPTQIPQRKQLVFVLNSSQRFRDAEKHQAILDRLSEISQEKAPAQ